MFPLAPAAFLPVVKVAGLVVCVDPSYSSIAVDNDVLLILPPADTAAVCGPAAATICLAVFTFPCSDHDVPSYSSTNALLPPGVAPAIHKPAVCVPQPEK